MKKIILLALTVLLLTPSLVLAVSDENVTKRRPDTETRLEVQEIRQERQMIRSNVAENHATRLEKRFTSYFTRFTGIIARFQARLDLLTKEGKNIDSVQTKLTAVSAKLTLAQAKGVEAVKAFRAIDPAKFAEQKTELLAARDLAVSARKLFEETHTLLKDALKALKVISKPALPAASAAVNQDGL